MKGNEVVSFFMYNPGFIHSKKRRWLKVRMLRNGNGLEKCQRALSLLVLLVKVDKTVGGGIVARDLTAGNQLGKNLLGKLLA